MIRIIVALLVLGLGAITWVVLLPEAHNRPPEPARLSPPVAATAAPKPVAVAVPPDAGREIRVVYPGPDAAATVRKIADKVALEAGPAPAIAAAMPALPPPPAAPPPAAPPPPAATAAPAQVAAVTPVPAATAATAAPAPSGPGQTVNINTASVDALNALPGVGRIGRTIASHRPYGSIEELVSRRVLRKSVYDRIKNQIAAN